MGRPTKEIADFKERINKLSYREKLKVLFDMTPDTEGDSLSQKRDILLKSFSKEEMETFENVDKLIYKTLVLQTSTFRGIYFNLRGISFNLIGILRDISIYRYTAEWLNGLMETYYGTTPEEERVPLFVDDMESFTSIFQGLNVLYSQDEGKYIVEPEELLQTYRNNLNTFRLELETAKAYNLSLKEFLKITESKDLLPSYLERISLEISSDFAPQRVYSGKVYNELTRKENLTTEERELLDSMDTSILFPDYEEIEPNKNYIGKNNPFIKQWEILKK